VNLKDPTGRGVLEDGYIEIKSPLETAALAAVGFAEDKCLFGIALTLLEIGGWRSG
jgi:hypothetical protein